MNTLPATARLAILVALLPLLALCLPLGAQSDTISASINTDAEELIRDIFLGAGQCFEVFNIELNGEPAQAGTFSNGNTSIGFDSGLVLSNGDIRDVSGPNLGYLLNDADASTGHGAQSTDPDLEILSALEGDNNPLFWDVVTLEFDFTPTLDTISFEYIFASEEYCDFAFTSFVDLFGFFISGPGISGPFTDNAINLAQVPGTSDAITAQNVNQLINNAFYNNNIPPGQVGCSFGQPAPNADYISFDGYTVPLTATTPVIPCETYHLKLVVADRGFDNQLDAAVFLRANSFAAGLTSRITSQVTGPNQGNDSPYEGCGFTSIIFSRGDSVVTNDLVVYYDLLANSTATPGLDYMALPDSVIIPAGQLTDTINLDFFADDITEGTEFFTIKLRNPCNCSESELTINILEPPPVSGAIVGPDRICEGDAVSLAAVPSGGVGELSYEWTNGDMDSLFNFVPSMTDTYEVIISDECGSADTIQQLVRRQAPTGSIDGNVVLCDGRPAEDLAIVLNDGDVFSFDVFENGTPIAFSNIATDTFFLSVSNTGVYQIGNLSADGCPGTVDGEAQVLVVQIDTEIDIDSLACFGDTNAAVSLHPVGGTGVYDYSWEHNSLLTTDSIGNLDIGTYTAYINDSNGCVDTISVVIDQPPLLELMVDTLDLFADCVEGGALEASASGGSGDYLFSWSDGANTALNDSLLAGDYQLEATDENGCLVTTNVAILADTLSPTLQLNAPDTLDCITASVSLDASGSSQGSNFTYQWMAPNGMVITPANPLLFDATEAGFYTLSITNTDNNCSITDSLEVIQETDGLEVNLSGDSSLSCFQPQGQLYFLDSMPDFRASWELLDGTVLADGVNSLDIFNAGTYVLVVNQISSGCVGTDTIVVTTNADAPILSLANTPDSLDCDISQVLVDMEVTNGSGNYTYNWAGPTGGIIGDNSAQDIIGSLPGTYELIVTDNDNGCQDTLSYEIIQDQTDLTINPLPDSVLTCDLTEVNYTASSPSTGNLQFEWFNEMGSSIIVSPDITIATPGIYTLVVSNIDNGCSQTTVVQVAADTVSPNLQIAVSDTLDCLTSSVTLNANGSDQGLNYEYQWTSPSGTLLNPVDPLLLNTMEAGVYLLSITNTDNSCSNIDSLEVIQEVETPTLSLINSPDSLGCNINEVLIDVEVTSGSGNYAYNWAGPTGGIISDNSAQDVIGSLPGTYELIVTDNDNGCQDTLSYEIIQDQTDLVINPLPDSVLTCDLTAINYTASSPSTGNLQFEWFNEMGNSIALSPNVTLSTPGTYTLELSDLDNGCSQTTAVQINADTLRPVVTALLPAELNCVRDSVDLAIEPGPDNYAVIWRNAMGDILPSQTWTQTVGDNGGYLLTVTDQDNGCRTSVIYEVIRDTIAPEVAVEEADTLTCLREEVALRSTIISGSGTFGYQWDGPPGGISGPTDEALATAVEAGTYSLTVTDSQNGCTAEITTAVEVDRLQPILDPLNDTLINCYHPAVVASGSTVSTGNLLFEWFDEQDMSLGQSPDLLISAAGTYRLVLTNSTNGCFDEITLSVTDDFTPPTADAGADVLIDCSDNTATLLGSDPENSWEPTWLAEDGTILTTGEWALTTNQPGLYTLQVLNPANGCQALDTAEISLDQNFPVAVVTPQNTIDCFSGAATIDASGSSQGADFTYQIVDSNGNTIAQPAAPQFELSTPGTYQLIITNTNNSCVQATSFEIIQTLPSILNLQVTDIPCDETSGSIVFSEVTNGTPPYLYSVDNGNTFSTNPIFSSLSTGSYNLLVQDINGCEVRSSAFIEQASGIELSLPEQVELGLLDVYVLNPTLINASPSELAEIKWTGSNDLSCSDCLMPTFTATETTRLLLSVGDENGCTATASILLLVDQTIPVYIPNVFSPDGLDGTNDYLTVYADAAQVREVRQMNIFDRWGGLVFSRNELPINTPAAGWDGTYNGSSLSTGVYVYWVEVILQNGDSKILEGDVLLLR